MHEAVDAVAPHVAPAIALENALDHRRRVPFAGNIDRFAIEHERQRRIIGNDAIIDKDDGVRADGTRGRYSIDSMADGTLVR